VVGPGVHLFHALAATHLLFEAVLVLVAGRLRLMLRVLVASEAGPGGLRLALVDQSFLVMHC
jgi:hypothetical protein